MHRLEAAYMVTVALLTAVGLQVKTKTTFLKDEKTCPNQTRSVCMCVFWQGPAQASNVMLDVTQRAAQLLLISRLGFRIHGSGLRVVNAL